MQRKRLFFVWVLYAMVVLPLQAVTMLDEFLDRKGVKEVRVLEKESIYERIVEVMIEQPLDHRNPGGGTFAQRLYISHMDPTKPVVLITAGYDASYYYTSELAVELQCNQILVEHRYFGRSRPDSLDWNYLDTWQAATDHHRIITLFRELYPGKWISSGISKGGQTVIYHSYYYPDDVDVRVPYVAPLNFDIEDERVYAFLDRVGTPAERRKVKRFQRLALRNQEKYLPVFREFSEKAGYTYDMAGGIEKAYEYCVLEYSFAFWQWGYVPASRIPGRNSDPGEIVEHMNRVAGFDYFSDAFITEYQPFFYQALTEMGYYGYEFGPFSRHIRHVDNPRFTFTIPDGVHVTYNPGLSEEVMEYLSEDGSNFIFIYGEFDTWSATAVPTTGNTNSRIFIKEGGSHRTRINNMPEEQRNEVYQTLKMFLETEEPPVQTGEGRSAGS